MNRSLAFFVEYLYDVSESQNSRKTLPLVYGNAAVNSSCIHVLFGYVWAFLTKTKQNDNAQAAETDKTINTQNKCVWSPAFSAEKLTQPVDDQF